jgi:PPP family 3-phenylpropionic acid transporter
VPLRHTPYWRLSGFYFFYFASLGVLVPYWSLYLQGEGFNAVQIGELTAILLGTRIVAPYIWGWIADHRGTRMKIVRFASFLGTALFSCILIDNSYLWIAGCMLIFSFFWNASLPQFEVTTLQHLGEHSHFYSQIRLWGSIGFILTVMLLGKVLEYLNTQVIPYAMLIAMTGIWLISLVVPESSSRHLHIESTSFWTVIKRPEVIAFLVVCFLVQVSHGPFYTFYTIYLEQHHYDRGMIGLLWAVGVIAEVIVFLFMHKWLPKLGIKVVLLISAFLGAVRWVLVALFPTHLELMLIAQLFHAASFGSFHVSAIAWVHHHFTGKHQGRGQALYSSVGFGAGGAIGSLYSGYFWVMPGPTATFLTAGAISFLAFAIGFQWLKSES